MISLFLAAVLATTTPTPTRDVDLGAAQARYHAECEGNVDIVREIDVGWARLTYIARCRS